MFRVKERLHDANVGEDTQAIEQDIIDALTHMRDALKKAQQELGKQPPPARRASPNNDPQLQKLLDEIAELKMIRELQKQVNDRTKRYGDKTPMAEQADDPQIKKELKDLGERQEKIETMVNNMVDEEEPVGGCVSRLRSGLGMATALADARSDGQKIKECSETLGFNL